MDRSGHIGQVRGWRRWRKRALTEPVSGAWPRWAGST